MEKKSCSTVLWEKIMQHRVVGKNQAAPCCGKKSCSTVLYHVVEKIKQHRDVEKIKQHAPCCEKNQAAPLEKIKQHRVVKKIKQHHVVEKKQASKQTPSCKKNIPLASAVLSQFKLHPSNTIQYNSSNVCYHCSPLP